MTSPNAFDYVVINQVQIDLMQDFREQYKTLYSNIDSLHKSRELSLAITNLEQSAFWLNKAISLQNHGGDK